MNKNIPWDIIIKNFKKEISSEEQALLNLWLSEGKNDSVYQDLYTLWLSIIEEGIDYKSDADKLWSRMELRLKNSEPKIIRLKNLFSMVVWNCFYFIHSSVIFWGICYFGMV
ncbi:MAG: hypothetical protein LUD46_21855 [Parabacteroides sp.]|nr:hypothetical protein [Parabacteroides sp.]